MMHDIPLSQGIMRTLMGKLRCGLRSDGGPYRACAESRQAGKRVFSMEGRAAKALFHAASLGRVADQSSPGWRNAT